MKYIFFALLLTVAAFSQTKTGEIENTAGTCSMMTANPTDANLMAGVTLSNYVACTDTVDYSIKIYSFPTLEYVKQIAQPPKKEGFTPITVTVTQKWFNNDDNFESLAVYCKSNNGKTSCDTYIYSESGSQLFNSEGYMSLGTYGNAAYLYTALSTYSGNKFSVYKLRDVQVAVNSIQQINKDFPKDIFVRLQGNEIIIDASDNANLNFVLVSMDGKRIAYSKKNSGGRYVIPLNDFSGVGAVAVIDGKGKIYGKTIIAK